MQGYRRDIDGLRAIAVGQVSAQIYAGAWTDVGTPERLQQLNQGA